MNFIMSSPITIFLILEKSKPLVWQNESTEEHSLVLWVDNSWYYLFNIIMKYEFYFQNSILIEHSCIDNKNNYLFFNNDRLIVYNLFYLYFTKFRLIVFTNTNKIESIDKLFKNSNWLERESSEMYGINYLFKTDIRRLLLDYSKIYHPMLKDYPTEGVDDVFYNILENQVVFNNNETVEL